MLIKLDTLGDYNLDNKTFGGVIGSSGGFYLPSASDLFSPSDFINSGVPVPSNTSPTPDNQNTNTTLSNQKTDLGKKAETLFNNYNEIIPFVVIGIIIYFLL